jgi:non-heme Fe2+,alpha-ketoglutarate-dependent halogenase
VTKENYGLTPNEIMAFERDGFFGPFKVYEPEEIENAWKKVRVEVHDRSHAAYELKPTGGLSIANYDRHLDIPFLSKHICRPQIVDRLNSVLGPDVLTWRTEFFPKYPGEKGTPWHQNSTFQSASGKVQLAWPEGSKLQGCITVWCAVTDSTIENGCLKLMPKTQYTRYYDEERGFKDQDSVNGFGYNFKEIQFDPDWKPDESQAFPLVLKAGEAIAFWSTLLHGSFPNVSNKMRLGFASRYVPSQVKIYPGTENVSEFGDTISLDRWGAVQVSGIDKFGHNKIVDRNLRGQRF